MVLFVVDAQEAIVTKELYQYDLFVGHVKELILAARNNGVEVIYCRHDDGPGTELAKGTVGYEVYSGFAPSEGERIFDKNVNSPFRDTSLVDYLTVKEETEIMVVGLQTDYCIDATVKCGFEHGFNIIVPEYCNSTYDNEYLTAKESYEYYNQFIWPDRYAKCITFEEALNMLTK